MMGENPFVSATIVVVAKNIGKSVALNVTIHGMMTLTEDSQRLDQEESAVCSGVIRTYQAPVVTVFPDDDTGYGLFIPGVASLPSKIEKPHISAMDAPLLSPPNSKLISPKFLGCVSYTYPTSSVSHHSGFRFALQYGETIPKGEHVNYPTTMLLENNNPHWVDYCVVGKNIPAKELRGHQLFGGFNAN